MNKIKILLCVIFLLLGTACSTKKNNWPRGMTPFFAECQSDMKVYTDRAYAERKRMPCEGGWKFYDRGEPTLTND